ncbi:MAG: hypothetical protein IIB27_01685 [Chloroflexi bacterium]|nr:hypothetical protein [Chloroflexota bacterium]
MSGHAPRGLAIMQVSGHRLVHRRRRPPPGEVNGRAGPDAPTSAVAITQESGQTRNASQVTLYGA